VFSETVSHHASDGDWPQTFKVTDVRVEIAGEHGDANAGALVDQMLHLTVYIPTFGDVGLGAGLE